MNRKTTKKEENKREDGRIDGNLEVRWYIYRKEQTSLDR